MAVSTESGDDRASPATLVDVIALRRTNLRSYGTVTRYAALMSDGIEREIIHGQAHDRLKPAARSVDLTIGTAPPLSVGVEGLVMHFVLKAMEKGIDGVVFGPERTRRGYNLGAAEIERVARRLSFAATADAAHLVADHLADTTGADLAHMLWSGISLGAMKGIAFAGAAPARGRTVVYSHFAVPVAPFAMPAPSDADLRRFQREELGPMVRLSGELLWHDLRDRTLRIHENVARASGPGLLWRYAKMPLRGREFAAFTAAWRDVVCSGEAGQAASALPVDRLATFELFDRDVGGPRDQWEQRLGAQLAAGTSKIVVHAGRHSDASRLVHQKQRALIIRAVADAIGNGTPVDDLPHPVAD